jgi:transforming growth factor-beta-induced protein
LDQAHHSNNNEICTMKSGLFTSVVATAWATQDVQLTSYYDAACTKKRPGNNPIIAKAGKCTYVNQFSINNGGNQIATCLGNGDLKVERYDVRDGIGICKKRTQQNQFRKGECFGYPDGSAIKYYIKHECLGARVAAAASSSKPNIVELAQSSKTLTTLVAAVVAGDLVETLSSRGPFTVFAPENKAFGKLPDGVLQELLKPENKAKLVDLLTYHVHAGSFSLALDKKKAGAISTVEGNTLQISVHIQRKANKSGIRVNQNRVKATNVAASNGLVHIIDGVLLPPGFVPPTPAPAPSKNIVELAESVKDLSTLVSAVVAGDLVDTLVSSGPFTVFAPTNEGFAALPAGVVDSLMKPENKASLVDILTYHVVAGQVLSTDLAAFQEVKTVESKKLHITLFGGVVKVGPSLESKDLRTVTAADNLASNGVVHIIDGVLLPPTAPTLPAPKAENIVV